MLCEKCGKNEANVYIKNVVNGDMTERRLCGECAAGENVNPFSGFGKLFPGMTAAPSRRHDAAGACPSCGMSAPNIARSGLVGCAQCYAHFEGMLDGMIRRLHGDVKHTGAVPKSAGPRLRASRRMSELKTALQGAIEREEFERAASLRDEIRALEQGGTANE